MRRRVGAVLAAAVMVGSVTAAVGDAAAAPPSGAVAGDHGSDEVVGPLEAKRRQMRQEGLARVLSGAASPERRGASTVVQMGTAEKKAAPGRKAGTTGQYVELAREKTDKVFVVLAEFGDQRHPDYPDKDQNPNVPGPTRFDGPRHNEITEPNRAVDNKTIWQPDFSRQHFQDIYFSQTQESLKTFYERASSGRYSVDGTVTDWVRVPYNEARYGRSDGYPCPGRICGNSWYLVADAVNQWVADRKAAGATAAQIKTELAEFDQWDRYDHDGDGDFNEPDGYIDHFQIVHAGGDQSDADPAQGEDAIWAHRWYAFYNTSSGPAQNRLGGAQIGDTGVWVGDYTVQPENGGLGVFAHEYGHDLGLPDHYDTVGPGGAQENGVNWWSLMGQSRVSRTDEPIGLRAPDLSAWDKLQLGWLDYETVVAGQDKKVELGPNAYNTDRAQGVVVVLPDKQRTDDFGAPFAGANMWWSDRGDNLGNTLTRSVDLTGRTSAELRLKARYDIEDCDCDYLFVEASTDGGTTWSALDGTSDGKPFARDVVGNPMITNSTGGRWVDVAVPLTALAGKNAKIRFRYRTDGGVSPNGFFADEITVTADGTPLFTDGAENGPNGWTAAGFRTTTGKESKSFDHFYVASNRAYTGYDQYLQPGPYDYGNPDRPNWATRFPYQNGLLVSYWDTSQVDNNTSVHPGEGLMMPVDANPEPIYNLQGKPWRPRVAGYDATFGLEKSDSFTLYAEGKPSYVRGRAAQPLFDDTKEYWFAAQPTAGVKLPKVGVRIKVLKQQGTDMTVRVFPAG